MKLGWQEVRLNGVQQWVSLRGNPRGPILLFLHGGPGGAEFGPRRKYLGALENEWMVADWEQRGAGRSFRGDETAATLSLDLLVDDATALVELLHERSHGRPIVLLGHSFGTVVGVLAAQRDSAGLAAFVGASQVVCWSLQEDRSYSWTLAEAQRRGDSKAIEALTQLGHPQAGVYASGRAGVETQRRFLGSFGGVSADPKFLARWVASIMTARDYPVRAKLRYQAGMSRSMELIWPELGARIDFARDVAHVPVPVYLFAGDQDRITDLDQIRDWFEQLDAPAKHLEVVERAGHLALYEAAPRFLSLMAQVRADLTSRPGLDTQVR